MRTSRTLLALAAVAAALASAAACGGGTSGTSGGSDSGAADAPTEAFLDGTVPQVDAMGPDSGVAGDSGAPVDANAAADSAYEKDVSLDCSPMPVDAGALPPFTPPNPPQSACTPAQVQGFYLACESGSTASCNTFFGDPANSPCIRCMITDSTASSWGPLVSYAATDTIYGNYAGCMALLDNDGGPGSCAAAYQSYLTCTYESCSSNCPSGATPAGLAAIGQCEDEAGASVCASYYPPAQLCPGSRYSSCFFADFQADFVGLGELFCASAPHDAGPD
jgi:hypothetical protein